ncbi:NAD+ synthase [Helicobacter muridarum]|uniref:NH(3)-dependent NAD(+) synthetase n=1 Tax=Helicobacter muridarum TaxID=216 RepID=A0A099TVM6_9HELI|nr:NAD+ synthase [Helicobacter muridarum]TLE01142.1 NAD+ synthase [Helicobacter muridarum]STQ86012.1 NAD synthetase [Helicobacter muridarum]
MHSITNKDKGLIIDFLRDCVAKRGFKKVILGLSGGIDSAVVAALCKEAFSQSKDNKESMLDVKCKVILMPSLSSSQSSIQDSLELCNKLDISYEILPIKAFDRAFCENYPNHSPLARGNFCARMRMATLYYVSQMEQRLVIGTSNKSEIMLGYGTIFGDLACAINPIGNLYKTQIYQLAQLLNIPESIINKPPSADLYQGQNDENELGYKYVDIDRFLESYECSNHKSNEEKIGYLKSIYPNEMVESLNNRILNNAFKTSPTEIFFPNFKDTK